MGLEGTMWRFLRPELHRIGLLTDRITDRLNQGRPDVLWLDTTDGLTGLCELKAPKPGQKVLGMRPGQALWLWRWAKGGGMASILARYPDDSWALYRPRNSVAWIGLIESEHYATLAHESWERWPGPGAIRDALRGQRAVFTVSVPGSPTAATRA